MYREIFLLGVILFCVNAPMMVAAGPSLAPPAQDRLSGSICRRFGDRLAILPVLKRQKALAGRTLLIESRRWPGHDEIDADGVIRRVDDTGAELAVLRFMFIDVPGYGGVVARVVSAKIDEKILGQEFLGYLLQQVYVRFGVAMIAFEVDGDLQVDQNNFLTLSQVKSARDAGFHHCRLTEMPVQLEPNQQDGIFFRIYCGM